MFKAWKSVKSQDHRKPRHAKKGHKRQFSKTAAKSDSINHVMGGPSERGGIRL